MPQKLLDEEAIGRLAKDPAMKRKFAFLRKTKKKAGSCCGRTTTTVDFDAVKRAILALQKEELAEFKAAIGADTVRMIYNNGVKVEDRILE